jgi:hypothetical protein
MIRLNLLKENSKRIFSLAYVAAVLLSGFACVAHLYLRLAQVCSIAFVLMVLVPENKSVLLTNHKYACAR